MALDLLGIGLAGPGRRLRGPYFPEPRAQRLRQPRFHLGCDEPDGVHVLDVDAVLQAIARELHANQIRHRRQENALGRSDGRGEVGHRLQVLGPHLLSDEDHMDGAPGPWIPRIDQHVDSRGVAIREAEAADGLDDRWELPPIHGDVHIAREAGHPCIAVVHVEEHGDATDHPVLDARLTECVGEATDGLEELFHVAIVGGNCQHSWPIMHAPSGNGLAYSRPARSAASAMPPPVLTSARR
jgi:hypothetical protein